MVCPQKTRFFCDIADYRTCISIIIFLDPFFKIHCSLCARVQGIWDCLTNEEAVKFVLDRIDTKTPAEIGTEMLDEIISIDPRETQGIGGDNMTVMIVDLLPAKRSHRKD